MVSHPSLAKLEKARNPAVLAITCTLILLLCSVVSYLYARHQVFAEFNSQVQSQMEQRGQLIRQVVNNYEQDLYFLSRVPVLQRIANAMELDQETEFTEFLGLGLKAYLESHPNATQVRLIGISDSGREVVRVEQTQGGARIVEKNQLQQKSDMDYFQDAIQINYEEQYLSNITLNKEYGKVQVPHVPTLRLARTIIADTGTVVGILVINLDVRFLFDEIAKNLPPNMQVFLMNQQGSFLIHPLKDHAFGFDLGNDYKWGQEYQSDLVESDIGLKQWSHESGTHLGRDLVIELSSKPEKLILNLALLSPVSMLYQQITELMIYAFLTSATGLFVILYLHHLYMSKEEQRQRASIQQTRLAAIVENTQDAIIGEDLEGRITDWNHAAEQMFGYHASEAIGQKTLALINPEDRYQEEKDALDAVATGQAPPQIDTVRRSQNGTVFDVAITISPIKDADGNLVGFSKSVRDISKQKAIENKIRALNDTLEQQLAEGVDEIKRVRDQLIKASEVARLGIWTWEIDSDALIWNPQMHEIYRVPMTGKGQVLNYDVWRSMLHPDDADWVVDVLKKSLEGKCAFDPEFRIQFKNGDIKYIKADAIIERDANNQPLRLLGINQDVTSQKTYEKQLQIAREQADAASQAKTEFVANISHEIRTPMNAILGMLALIKKTDLSVKQLDYANKASDSAKSLMSVINDVLDFSKVESGKLALDNLPCDLRKILQEVKEMGEVNKGDKPIEMRLSIDNKLPHVLELDGLRLQQVMTNLVGNAVKFTDSGSIDIKVQVLTTSQECVQVEFSVIDTGIGISTEQSELIFDGFSQAEANTARKYGGTGLGLAISRKLVRLMGGEISLDSKLGRGSEFSFNILCGLSDIHSDEFSRLPDFVGGRSLCGLHILLVEDNETNQQVATELLQQEGAIVDVVDNGLQAVTELSKDKIEFDLVLMDIQMPVMDGYTATREIRENLGLTNLPIIAMTANALDTDRKKALSVGMNEHVGKPFDLEKLVQVILKQIGKSLVNKGNVQANIPISEPAPEPQITQEATKISPSPDTPILDMASALKRFGNNKAIYTRSLQSFLKEAPGLLRQLPNEWEVTQATKNAEILHSLKGMAATLGAESLKELAGELEQQSKAKDSKDYLVKRQSLAKKLVQTCEKIELELVNLNEKNDGHATAIHVELKQELEKLVVLLEQSNLEALNVFEQLKPTLAKNSPDGHMELDQLLTSMDFKGALESCRQIQQKLMDS